MEGEIVARSVRDAMWVAAQLGGPILVTLLAIGLSVSVLQALTQVQEASLAFLPKLVATGAAMLLLGPFMLGVLRDWTVALMQGIVAVGGMP